MYVRPQRFTRLGHRRIFASDALRFKPAGQKFWFYRAPNPAYLQRRLTFSNLYADIIGRWPPEVGIGDASMVSESGGKFPTLLRHWDDIEERVRKDSDVLRLMSWAVFCGFHQLACKHYLAGERLIYRAAVDRDYVKFKFEESLFPDDNSDYYAPYRDSYVSD